MGIPSSVSVECNREQISSHESSQILYSSPSICAITYAAAGLSNQDQYTDTGYTRIGPQHQSYQEQYTNTGYTCESLRQIRRTLGKESASQCLITETEVIRHTDNLDTVHHQFTELLDTCLQLFMFTLKDTIMATITITMDFFMRWDML
ncbi:unnamed protein product [Caenorhabditis brenneri]